MMLCFVTELACLVNNAKFNQNKWCTAKLFFKFFLYELFLYDRHPLASGDLICLQLFNAGIHVCGLKLGQMRVIYYMLPT